MILQNGEYMQQWNQSELKVEIKSKVSDTIESEQEKEVSKLEQWINKIQLKELLEGTNNCPHKLLGCHSYGEGQVITAYRPVAKTIRVVDKERKNVTTLEALGEEGFFGVYLEKAVYNEYLLEIEYGYNDVVITEDPYSFKPLIGDLDIHLFAEGNHYQIYEKLGAHPQVVNGVQGTYFAVYAPNARSVSVVGSFNMWDGRLHPMRLLGVSGIYELFIPHVAAGAIYKYQILTRDGEYLHKCDPYANSAELRPNNASVVADISSYEWSDKEWIKRRQEKNRLDCRREPMSIYEMHLGSWKKKEDGTEDGFYNYRELAPMLAEYLQDMGYTHVELMGIAEHPFDGSWGYQVTGYYAPTRRYGSPEDFMYFVDYLHNKGIYVILDWVPAHFPKDAHGLARFDGVALYEHPDPRRGEHPHWGTYIFNYGKKEVENFLIANALFWIEKFHVDGLRVDAVASMLYLDYGKEPGEWLPNENGGKENLDVIQFLQHMNNILEQRVPGALMIAEESTSWQGVTAPVAFKGLGFLFKWNMGWMNDFLEYMKLDPYFRQFNHNKLTFSLAYAYSENFIQVLSHDEVVHGKCSMINKMPGVEGEKFANLRTAYGFMYGHPGKKLLFMGQEFAQWREWSEARSLDWNLLGEQSNAQMHHYVRTLNKLYQRYSAFYYNDSDPIGFEWMSCEDAQRSIVSFIRRGETSKEQLLFVYNFTPVIRENYRIGVPCCGTYTEILNSDSCEFGGSGLVQSHPLKAKLVKNKVDQDGKENACLQDGQKQYIEFTIPPLSVVVFVYDYKESVKRIVEKNKK